MDEIEVEGSNIVTGMKTTFQSGDCQQRRNLLRSIVVQLFTSPSFPSQFVQAYGIDLLILAVRDPEPKIRLLAVHALSRLVELGYEKQVKRGGAEKELLGMRNDPYQPLRNFAERCLTTISGPDI